jgi:hypothetical protein
VEGKGRGDCERWEEYAGSYVPVFGVAAAHDDFDNDLIRLRLWNRYILNSDLWAFGNDSFLHLLTLSNIETCECKLQFSCEFYRKYSESNNPVRQRGFTSLYI